MIHFMATENPSVLLVKLKAFLLEGSLTIAPELEIVWILAGATAGTRLESGWFLAASTKTIE